MGINMLLVGIDPGVNTGLAIWDKPNGRFTRVETLLIHEALLILLEHKSEIIVCMEDARQRRWFGKSEKNNAQGVGSIKRDCGIIEDACKDWNIQFIPFAPALQKGLTKWTAERFKKVTGWAGRTSVHARDAALIVYGR